PPASRRRLVLRADGGPPVRRRAMNAPAPDTAVAGFVPLSSHVAADVLKTTGGDYLVAWQLGGLPFVGREEWDIEHRHATFNRLLQSLRAPAFPNGAFWSHDIRRRRRIRGGGRFDGAFHQALSDAYFDRLAQKESLQNELHLSMLYRPLAAGRSLVERSADLDRLRTAERQAVDRIHEL